MLKLFHILPTTHAFFGQKDYQQLAVIRAMVRDLDAAVQIVGCPIVRDADGLALSSRNVYLSAPQRQTALAIPETLDEIERRWLARERNIESLQRTMAERLQSTELQYATIRDAETLQAWQPNRPAVALIATRVGTTRLIDNRVLT